MLKIFLHHHNLKVWKARNLSALFSLMILCIMATGTSADEPVFSQTNKFKIPFQFDQAELQKIGAEKIQLFVSVNRGASWRLHDSVLPDAGKFTYEAAEDGEYWFSVRTRTANGLTFPTGDHEPGLKVVIDTKQPTLSLDLTETQAGEVELQWNATDQHLVESSLQLEFLDPVQQTWESVSIRPSRQGRTSWTVRKAGLVEVRGRIRDTAGNLAEIATQTIVAGITTPGTVDQKNSRPIANDAKPQMLANQPLDVGIEIQPKNGAKTISKFQGTDLVLPETLQLEKTPVTAVSNGNKKSELKPLVTAAPEKAPHPLVGDPFSTNPPQPTPLEQSGIDSASSLSRSENPQASKVRKELTEKKLVNVQLSPSASAKHLVNSSTFRIAYELEDVGPSGVSNVELYITENGGAKWFHYGSDQDRVSPIVATVPRDGEYGFSFRIRNGAGIVATPPQPGEKPEIVITVDQARPVVKVKSPLKVEEKEKLKIEWTASDQHLDANAVAIYYALKTDGPWRLIDGWKPNTNQYTWKVPHEVASQFFLRLDVRDSAGNVTRHDVKTPYSIDIAKPTARVTEIESLKSDPK